MFKRITIKNFRSCIDTTLELDRTICALSGKNGVGKSNILKAIEWVTQSVVNSSPISYQVTGMFRERAPVHIILEMELSSQSYVYELRDSDPIVYPMNGQDFGLEESLAVVQPNGERSSIFERTRTEVFLKGQKNSFKLARSTSALALLNSFLPAEDAAGLDIARVHSFLSRVCYYRLDATAHEGPYVPKRQYREWLSAYLENGSATGSVSMRLIYMQTHRTDLLEEFEALIGRNGLGLIDHISVLSIDGELPHLLGKPKKEKLSDLYMLHFHPSDEMGGGSHAYYFPFEDLSLGTQRVIRILLSLIFDDRAVMLIEEPENSIHPGLLSQVMSILKTYSDPDRQIVLTTQSPEVLDALDPEEISLVSAPEGKTEVQRLSEQEVERAKRFLKNEGRLSEFLEPLVNL